MHLTYSLTFTGAPAAASQQPRVSEWPAGISEQGTHPFLPLQLSTAACCVLWPIILCDKHCQQTNIT